MTTNKIFELGEKFAKKLEQNNDNARFSQQREHINKFSHKLLGELKSILNEMDGDLLVLREKKIDPNVLTSFKNIKSAILTLFKDIDPMHPYEGTERLIRWAEHRTNKSMLDNLHFIISHYLDTNKEDFVANKYLQPVKSESIKKFQNLLKMAKQYISENPLLPDPRLQSTVPPPRLYNVKEDNIDPIGSQDLTMPGSPDSKKLI
jgi:hypothetical protein